MQPPAGLVIVHGIGNQPVGGLRDALAARLSDAGVPSLRSAVSAPEPAGAPGLQATPATQEVLEIRVDGAPVLVCEANWADVSHPDNPPRVRESRDVVTEFYRTVRVAWHLASRISPADTVTPAIADPKPMLVWLGIAALVNAMAFIGWRLEWSADALLAAFNESEVIQGGIGFGIACLCVYSTVQAVRKWKRQEWEFKPRHPMRMFIRLPLVVLWGFSRPVFFMFGAEMLLFLSFGVFAAYPVGLFGWLLAYPFRGAGRVLSCLGLRSPARWVHRLGSVMIVLPTQSYLQAVKATGNLFSILFAEKGAVVRLNALLWLIWVLAGFLLLLAVSEVLVLIPLAVFLPDAQANRQWFDVSIGQIAFYFVIVLPVYLLMLRILLPAIDLALDVSNYHLASVAERQEYFARLDRGVSALARSGCKEIHLLAHSLGSVIAYDWLQSRDLDSRFVVNFHTIGSPLDKFWYVDHGQQGRGRDRQSLQGRIAGTWINHWAFSDPVSGQLHRYDVPSFRLTNNRVRWLGLYMYSHGRYWTNEAVVRSVRTSLKAHATCPPIPPTTAPLPGRTDRCSG